MKMAATAFGEHTELKARFEEVTSNTPTSRDHSNSKVSSVSSDSDVGAAMKTRVFNMMDGVAERSSAQHEAWCTEHR